MRTGVALGSNLGNRRQFLAEARRRILALHEGPGPFLCSRIYETEPLDCPPGSPAFWNAAIELSISLAPLEILDELQAIEVALGRPARHEFHGPRTIDLDLLFCDAISISCERLTLPHPRIAERPFVLDPLCDICPERKLPGMEKNLRDTRAACQAGSVIVGPFPIV